jgi:hypothetical protein
MRALFIQLLNRLTKFMQDTVISKLFTPMRHIFYNIAIFTDHNMAVVRTFAVFII